MLTTDALKRVFEVPFWMSFFRTSTTLQTLGHKWPKWDQIQGGNGARFAYMTKYFVMPLPKNFALWPICEHSLRSFHKFQCYATATPPHSIRIFPSRCARGKIGQTCSVFCQGHDKVIYWVLSDIERNKVMNFGEPSPNSVATGD